MHEGRVATRTGLLFAALGGAGTYAGTRANAGVSGPVLLVLLAALTVFLAARMWRKGSEMAEGHAGDAEAGERARPLTLVATALATGFASGFFGIGGGFVIVPALVLVAGLPMGTAVATSLLVISINGAIDVASYEIQGRPIDYFVVGFSWRAAWAGCGRGRRWGNTWTTSSSPASSPPCSYSSPRF
jgi:uncharacterized membrane protein YfcA